MIKEAKDKVEEVGQTISQTAGEAYQKAGEFASSAADRTKEALHRAGDYASSASGRAKEAVSSMGEYLRPEDIRGMADEVTTMIKRYPLPAIAVSFGIGMLLASMTRR